MALMGGASFSKDRKRRLHLWRRWDTGPKALFICLNPSTATASKEDQSTRKMRGFAERAGCGSYLLMNLFDYRTTYPEELYKKSLAELCSPDNFSRIRSAARDVRYVICAWGRHGKLHDQGQKLLQFLRERGVRNLFALKMNSDGTPAHVLMLPYSCRLIVLDY